MFLSIGQDKSKQQKQISKLLIVTEMKMRIKHGGRKQKNLEREKEEKDTKKKYREKEIEKEQHIEK